VTINKEDQFAAIRMLLEERYEFHTGRLQDLIAREEDPGLAGVNAALRSQFRQALSDVAGALRHMAEGSYGRCLDCENDIPIERLEVRPDALLCAGCQQRHERYRNRGARAA
jgi:RNA polymerase-binding transcription factor